MTDTPMIERVARAIAVVTIPSYADDDHWREHWAWYLRGRGKGGSADYSTQAQAERQARAAIEAMREPTEAMLRFGTDLEEGGAMLPDDWWRGMIDAALR